MKSFNIIIAGVGGQGLITLTRIIAEAAMIEGYDVKTSELHGLSQRGGSVQTYIRFGKKVYSPLISSGEADLILGLELSEVLRNIHCLGAATKVLSDKHRLPYIGALSERQLIEKLRSSLKNLCLISASEICGKKLGKKILAGVYLLGWAAFRNFIPLKPVSLLKAAAKIVPEKYLELNKKAFNLAKKND